MQKLKEEEEAEYAREHPTGSPTPIPTPKQHRFTVLSKNDEETADDFPPISDACHHLNILGLDESNPLHCGTGFSLFGALHFRPAYLSGNNNYCSLYFHPKWQRWVVGSPMQQWKDFAQGTGVRRPVVLLMNGSPAFSPDEIEHYKVYGGGLVDEWVVPLDSPADVALHKGRARPAHISITCTDTDSSEFSPGKVPALDDDVGTAATVNAPKVPRRKQHGTVFMPLSMDAHIAKQEKQSAAEWKMGFWVSLAATSAIVALLVAGISACKKRGSGHKVFDHMDRDVIWDDVRNEWQDTGRNKESLAGGSGGWLGRWAGSSMQDEDEGDDERQNLANAWNTCRN